MLFSLFFLPWIQGLVGFGTEWHTDGILIFYIGLVWLCYVSMIAMNGYVPSFSFKKQKMNEYGIDAGNLKS